MGRGRVSLRKKELLFGSGISFSPKKKRYVFSAGK
jgi:hypothetical protein